MENLEKKDLKEIERKTKKQTKIIWYSIVLIFIIILIYPNEHTDYTPPPTIKIDLNKPTFRAKDFIDSKDMSSKDQLIIWNKMNQYEQRIAFDLILADYDLKDYVIFETYLKLKDIKERQLNNRNNR